MAYITTHPVAASLIGLYLLIVVGTGLYALTCDTEWCRLILVIPLTPWPQLDSLLSLDLPRLLLPIGVVLNIGILHYIGYGLETLFIRQSSS